MIFTYILYNTILFSNIAFLFLAEKTKHYKYIFLFLSFLIIFFPAAIRYNIGADYFSYVNIFNEIKFSPEGYHKELGFLWINQLLIYLNLGPQSLFVFTSFIIYIFTYLSFPQKNKLLFSFIFITTFYLVSFNLVRTAIVYSISLAIFSNIYFKKNNLILNTLLFTFGFLIHKSILLILAIPIISFLIPSKLLKNRLFIIATYILVLILFYNRNEMISILMSFDFIKNIGYSRYINSVYLSQTKINSGIGIILSIIPFIWITIFSRHLITFNNKNKYIVISSLIYIFAIMCSSSFVLLSRIERTFIFIIPISIYAFYSCGNIRKIVRLSFTIYIIIWYLLLFETNINIFRSDVCAGSRVSPYVSIFNKEDDKSLKIIHSECLKNEIKKNAH